MNWYTRCRSSLCGLLAVLLLCMQLGALRHSQQHDIDRGREAAALGWADGPRAHPAGLQAGKSDAMQRQHLSQLCKLCLAFAAVDASVLPTWHMPVLTAVAQAAPPSLASGSNGRHHSHFLARGPPQLG